MERVLSVHIYIPHCAYMYIHPDLGQCYHNECIYVCIDVSNLQGFSPLFCEQPRNEQEKVWSCHST